MNGVPSQCVELSELCRSTVTGEWMIALSGACATPWPIAVRMATASGYQTIAR